MKTMKANSGAAMAFALSAAMVSNSAEALVLDKPFGFGQESFGFAQERMNGVPKSFSRLTAEIGPSIYGLEISLALKMNRYLALRAQTNVISNTIISEEIKLVTNNFSSVVSVNDSPGEVFTKDVIKELAALSTANLDSYTAILDIHPFGGNFRISGGYSYGVSRGVSVAMNGQKFTNSFPSVTKLMVKDDTINSAVEASLNSPTFLADLPAGVEVDVDAARAYLKSQLTAQNVRNHMTNNITDISTSINMDKWIPYVGFGWSGPVFGAIGMFFNVGCFILNNDQLTAELNYNIGAGASQYDYTDLLEAYNPEIVLEEPGIIDLNSAKDEIQRSLDDFNEDLPENFKALLSDGLPVIPIPVVSIGLTLSFF